MTDEDKKNFFADSVPSPPDFAESMPWAAKDSLAKEESERFGELDDLQKQHVANNITWLKTYGIVVMVMTVVFTVIFGVSLIVWSLHYILPESCLWLSADQLSKIQSVLFSGGMGAIVSSIIKNQLDNTKGKPESR